jgi:hypothetical protein
LIHSLSDFIKGDVFVFLGVLFAIIAYSLLTGSINTRGLLMDKHGSRGLSPGRVQLLILTLAAAFNYLNNVVHDQRGVLPEISSAWLYVLGGSHATYLGGKALSRFRGKTKTKDSN